MSKKQDEAPDAGLSHEPKLGINRGVYALGNSVKDSLIWATTASLLTLGVIGLGKSRSKSIEKLTEGLDKLHVHSKDFTGAAKNFLKDKLKFDVSGPAVAASLGVGWLVGHIVQVPSSIAGWRAVQRATDKHKHVVEENQKLTSANAELVIENQIYKKEMDAVDPTFSKRFNTQASHSEKVKSQPQEQPGILSGR